MAYPCKKYLSLLLSAALINSSIQPLYASIPEHEDVVVREAQTHSRRMILEDTFQGKIKNSAPLMEQWTPSFIKNAALKLGTWVESTLGREWLPDSLSLTHSDVKPSSPLMRISGTDYYEEQIESLIDSPLQAPAMARYLKEMQELVWQNAITSETYLKGLKDLSVSLPQHKKTFSKVASRFQTVLKQRMQVQHKADRDHLFTLTALQALPYYGQEIDPIYTTVAKGTSYKGILKGFVHTAYKGMDFVLQNPGKAFTLGLAGQVAASSAYPFQPWYTSDISINNYSPSSDQTLPSVAALANGNAFIAWQSNQDIRGNIYGCLASIDPTYKEVSVGNEFLINKVENSFTADHPAALGLANGNIFVTWQAQADSTSNYNIYGRILSSNGTALNDEFLINQDTTLGSIAPSVTLLANGNVFSAWNDQSNIHGRIFFPNGTAFNNEFLINQISGNGFSYSHSATTLKNGDVFVVWDNDPDRTGNVNIYGRIFSVNGDALNSEFSISQGGNISPYAALTRLMDGNVFVAWRAMPVFNYLTIKGRILSANGIALTDEFLVTDSVNARYFLLTSLKNGYVLATLWDYINGVIYGDLLYSNGTEPTPNPYIDRMNINSGAASPSVAVLKNGDPFVVWNAYRTSADIYGQVYSFPFPALTTSTTGDSTTGSITTGSATTGAFSTTSGIATSSPSSSSTTQEITGTSVTESSVSSSHRLSPRWLPSPIKAFASAFNKLWEMTQNAQ